MADEQAMTGTTTAEAAAAQPRGELRSFAELLGLSSLAFAQPILSTFGEQAGEFVKLRASTFDILAFLVIVVLGPPIALWVIERLVGLTGRTPRTWFHRAAIAGLVATFLFGTLREAAGTAAALLVSLALGLGATVLVVRSELAQRFLQYLAFSPILFVGIFLFFTPVTGLVFGGDPDAAGEVVAGGDDGGDLPPIVMIVLDELPLESLLDGGGEIDPEAYPTFAELASGATLARNHTSVSPATFWASPAIVSGVLPSDAAALATAEDHPRTLFTLLGDSYRLRAGEHATELCPPSMCETPDEEGSSRVEALPALLRSATSVPLRSLLAFDIGDLGLDAQEQFDWLAEGFEGSEDEPTLHYLHTTMPHQDWVYLPDGAEHDAPNPPVGMISGGMPEVQADATVAEQRFQLQLAYADQLFGNTIQALRDAGLYEEALIVVTSDHGVSFLPGGPSRFLTDDNAADVLWTPLIVKAPGQTEPRVIDSPTSSVDLLPTIVDLLDIETDWEFDGESIFAEPRPADWERSSFGWVEGLEEDEDGFVTVDGVAGQAEALADRGLEYGSEWDLRPWRWGEFGDLVGQEVGSFEQGDMEGVTATIDDPDRFEDVELSATVLPAYVSGEVEGADGGAVAVAVNDVVAGWYDTSGSPEVADRRRFQVMVPPSLLRNGSNDVEVYLIEGDGADVVLVPAGRSE